MTVSTATAASPMTAEEFFEWAARPENADRRYELEAGRAVEMPSPSELHGYVIYLIFRLLVRYFDERGTGYVLSNDTGLVVATAPDTVRGPDLMGFLDDRPIEEMSRKHCVRVPALVVEVLSPSDRISRTNTRIEQYLRRGVSLVWLVDPDDRTVTVYRPNEFHRVLTEDDTLTGNGVLPSFSLKVASFFVK
jgi:Uma2 family endonuclease